MVDESAIVDIEFKDITTELEYWKNAIVCYVFGALPPFTVIQWYIERLWSKHGIKKIMMSKNGLGEI